MNYLPNEETTIWAKMSAASPQHCHTRYIDVNVNEIESDLRRFWRAFRIFSVQKLFNLWSLTKQFPTTVRVLLIQLLLGCVPREDQEQCKRRKPKDSPPKRKSYGDWRDEKPDKDEPSYPLVEEDDLGDEPNPKVLAVPSIRNDWLESHSDSTYRTATDRSDTIEIETSQVLSQDTSNYGSVSGNPSIRLGNISQVPSSSAIELLEAPTASPGDKKEYRVIRLLNGIKATIISEPKINDMSGKNEEFSVATHPGNAESAKTASRGLERDLSPIAIEEQLAACAVTLQVGSFQDPDDIPGLCHLLEHVVSMGSEKYPKEDAFDEFIEKSGGSYNAETDCDYTTFYFECRNKFLSRGLDMISQFFKSPLIMKKSVSKEIDAINEEFRRVKKNENARRMQIICGCAAKDNPAKKFTWGNLQSLTNVSMERLMEALAEFKNTHFTAQNINVAVQASVSSAALADLVDEYFGDMRISEYTSKPSIERGYPFIKAAFRKLYKVQSIKDRCELNVNWVFWPMSTRYRSKPLEYLSYLIAAEGEGSLIAHLRKKEEGRKNIKNVLKAFFEYLRMLERAGPSKDLFKELQKIAALNFDGSQDMRAIDNTKMISRHMTIYPPQDYLTGSSLFFEFCPSDIQDCLDVMTPDNANILLHSKKHDQILHRIEPWFKTKYRSDAIPDKWIQECADVEDSGHFNQPKHNPYLPNDFTLIREKVASHYPVMIRNTNVLELWFKGDNTFNTPQTTVDILISTSDTVTLENSVCRTLFAKMLKYQLINELYFAHIALIKQKITTAEQGLEISIFGLSHKLPKVLKVIARGLLDFQMKLKDQQKILEHLKKMMKNGMIQILSHGASLLEDMRTSLLMNVTFRLGDKYLCLNHVRRKELERYWRSLLEDAHVVALVQGNITSAAAGKMMEKFVGVLGMKKGQTSRRVQVKILKVPRGVTILCLEAFNPREENGYSQFYYQYGPGNEKVSVALQIFVTVINKYFVDKIPSPEFHASSAVSEIQGILGVLVTVHSKMDKFSLEYVREKVDYLMSGVLWYVESIAVEDFDEVVRATLCMKTQKPKRLKDESSQNWWEIKTGQYNFDRNAMEIKELQNMNQLFVAEVVGKILCPKQCPDKARKIAIQIRGFNAEEREHLRYKPTAMKSYVDGDVVVYGYASTEAGEATIVKDTSEWKESVFKGSK